MLESLFKLILSNWWLKTSDKNSITVFSSIGPKYDFILSNFSSLEVLQHSVCHLSRSVNDGGFSILDPNFLPQFALFPELLLNQ